MICVVKRLVGDKRRVLSFPQRIKLRRRSLIRDLTWSMHTFLSRDHLLNLIANSDALFVSDASVAAAVPAIPKSGSSITTLANNALDVVRSSCVLVHVLRLIDLALLLRLKYLRLLNLHGPVHG